MTSQERTRGKTRLEISDLAIATRSHAGITSTSFVPFADQYISLRHYHAISLVSIIALYLQSTYLYMNETAKLSLRNQRTNLNYSVLSHYALSPIRTTDSRERRLNRFFSFLSLFYTFQPTHCCAIYHQDVQHQRAPFDCRRGPELGHGSGACSQH